MASAGLLVSGCGLSPPRQVVPEAHIGSGVSARAARHRFPKLANQLQLCYGGDETRTLFDQLPHWDLAVVDAEMVRELPQYLGREGKIRTQNPDAILLSYFSAGDVNPHLPQPINQGYIRGLDPSWYLHDSSGERVPLFEMRPGVWTLAANQTTEVNRYLPRYLNETVVATGLVDGVFYDWVSTSVSWINRRPTTSKGRLDIDGDGRADADDVVDAKWTRGVARLLHNSREIFPPGTLIVGNGGWNTGPAHVPLLNGIMIERFLDGESEHAGWFGWPAVMRTYAESLARGIHPRISILMANSDDSGDLRHFRFALASALMFDGYFCFTNKDALNGYKSAWWYDEYSVDLATGDARRDPRLKGYLGHPLSEALDERGGTLASALASGGGGPADDHVWRRDFLNGIVLVNPSRTDRHVDLGGRFRRIRGAGDPRTNPGGETGSADLPPRSGLILLRLSPA